jgi:hypothetical protein
MNRASSWGRAPLAISGVDLLCRSSVDDLYPVNKNTFIAQMVLLTASIRLSPHAITFPKLGF